MGKIKPIVWLFMGILGAVVTASSFARPVLAATGINQQINYQARLLDVTGATVPDGTYNMEFKIYQDGTGCVSSGTPPCSGTLDWTETRTGANKVTVKNGYFSVELGSVTAFSNSVNWNWNTLWLSVNIGGTGTPSWDGEMTPFRRLDASPYSLNSNQLGGLTAAQFLQLAPGSAQADSSTASSMFINKTGSSGNIVELQKSGSDVATLSNSGAFTLRNATNSTTALQLQNLSGANVLTVDTSNTALVLGNDGTPSALTVRGGAATGTNIAGSNITFDASNGTGTGGSGDLIFRTAPATNGVTYDTSTSANQDSFNNTLTWTHTTTTNTNRLIIVSVIEGNGDSVSSVTYGAATLSQVNSTLCFGSACKVEMWATATSVPSGANTVTVTWTSSNNHRTAGASTYYNVDTTTPLGTSAVTSGSSSPASVTVSSTTTQQLVADAFGYNTNATWTPGTGQVQGVNQNNATTGTIYSSSKTGTASSTTLSWTNASPPSWGEIGVPINAASSSTADPLADRLHITASGNVGIGTASPAFTLDVAGSQRIEPIADSTTAFQIQSATGTQLFVADTTNSRIYIGSPAADSTGTILVLDTKNTSGDPTSVVGGMYYNSNSDTSRCDQGNLGWTDCLGMPKPNTRRWSYIQYPGSGTAWSALGDVATASATTTTATPATTRAWFTSLEPHVRAGPSLALQQDGWLNPYEPRSSEPGSIDYATSTTSGNVASMIGNIMYNSSNNPMYQSYAAITATTNIRMWLGLTNQTPATMGASANPAGNYAAFRYDTSVPDTKYQCITKDGTTQTITNSNISATTSGHKFEIDILSGTSVEFKIDNAVVCTNTTHLPAASTLLGYVNSATTLTTSAAHIRPSWVYVESTK